MNRDDPNLTAYALGELDPEDRAALEKLLQEDPAARGEVDATRQFCAQLRQRLHAEPTAPLHAAQRARVLATVSASVVSVKAPKVQRSAWPRRWLALAASLVIGAGVSMVLPVLYEVQPRRAPSPRAELPLRARAGSDVTVQLSTEAPGVPGNEGMPHPSAYHLSSEALSIGQLSPNRLTTASPEAPDVVNRLFASTDDYRRFKMQTLEHPESASSKSPVAGENRFLSESSGIAGRPLFSSRTRGLGVVENVTASRFGNRVKPLAFTLPLQEKKFSPLEAAAGLPGLVAEDGEPASTESYADIGENSFLKVRQMPLSTFSIDVDTASYSNVRRFLNSNQLPPTEAVRIEELVNYFDYDYAPPADDAPFSAAMEVAACPWAPGHRLVRVALRGREIQRANRPASNLVFLIDVSGSMQPENKLPLLKRSLQLMVEQLGEHDRVAIVVYAGAAGCVLESTTRKADIQRALDRLNSGGATHGSQGLQLAYELAQKHFIKGGTNRVILATDGDWNVGVTSKQALWEMIAEKAKSRVFLTVLGFGLGNLKDEMLEKLADVGNGNYAYIDTINEGRKVLVEELGATLVTIAKDVKIQVEFNPGQVGAYRLIGYENRALAAEDFADDQKDAGEIGAGHRVTAFYELIPAAAEHRLSDAPRNANLLTLRLRYKEPEGDTSTLREFSLKDSGHSFAQSSRDFRFAAAVVGYGMLLRGSSFAGDTNWNLVHELAVESKGEDRDGYRAEFVGLVEKARAISR